MGKYKNGSPFCYSLTTFANIIFKKNYFNCNPLCLVSLSLSPISQKRGAKLCHTINLHTKNTHHWIYDNAYCSSDQSKQQPFKHLQMLHIIRSKGMIMSHWIIGVGKMSTSLQQWFWSKYMTLCDVKGVVKRLKNVVALLWKFSWCYRALSCWTDLWPGVQMSGKHSLMQSHTWTHSKVVEGCRGSSFFHVSQIHNYIK